MRSKTCKTSGLSSTCVARFSRPALAGSIASSFNNLQFDIVGRRRSIEIDYGCSNARAHVTYSMLVAVIIIKVETKRTWRIPGHEFLPLSKEGTPWFLVESMYGHRITQIMNFIRYNHAKIMMFLVVHASKAYRIRGLSHQTCQA